MVADRAIASRVVGSTGSSVSTPVVLLLGSWVSVSGGSVVSSGVLVSPPVVGSTPVVLVEVEVEVEVDVSAVDTSAAREVVASSRVTVAMPLVTDAVAEAVSVVSSTVACRVEARVDVRDVTAVVDVKPLESAFSVATNEANLVEKCQPSCRYGEESDRGKKKKKKK